MICIYDPKVREAGNRKGVFVKYNSRPDQKEKMERAEESVMRQEGRRR